VFGMLDNIDWTKQIIVMSCVWCALN